MRETIRSSDARLDIDRDVNAARNILASAVLITVLVACLGCTIAVSAQVPGARDCATEVRAAVAQAELRATSDRIEAATRSALLEQENARLRGRAGSAEERLSAEQKTSTSLSGELDNAQQRAGDLENQLSALVKERNETVAALTAERDKALAEAKRSRRWIVSFARVFGVKQKR